MAQVQIQKESHTPNIGLDEKVLGETSELLCRLVSDETILGINTINYSFNVIGPRAHMLCQLFTKQSGEIASLDAKIARNLRAMGYKVPNVAEKLHMARVGVPKVGEWPDANSMVSTLMTHHETVVQHLCRDRERLANLKVKCIEDLLLETERCHLQWAWELRAHLETPGAGGGRA